MNKQQSKSVKTTKVIPQTSPVSLKRKGEPKLNLANIKELLLKRLDEALQYQHQIESQMTAPINEEPGDLVDKSEELEAFMTRESMNQHVTEELRQIQIALRRIEEGSFGECEACEEQIPLSRLKVRPDASLCLACQEVAERARGIGMKRAFNHGHPVH